MPNKSQSPRFAEIAPTGAISAICGMGAISILSRNLLFACCVGVIGLLIGIVTLRMQVERLDKILAGFGIALSIIPIVYAIVTIL